MRPDRASYAVHSWTGLLSGWLLFAICLTGTLVVYKFPLKSLSNPQIVSAALPDAIGPDGALAAFRTAHPELRPKVIAFPSDIYSIHVYSVVALDGRGKEQRFWIEPATGRVHAELESDFADFVQRLHAGLFAGRPGCWVVGILGVTMAVSLIAGLVFHWRKLRRDLFHLRLHAPGRKAWSDLHKFGGVWALPFHLVIALTGAWLGLESLIGITASSASPVEIAGSGPGAPRPIAWFSERARQIEPSFTPTHINFTHYGAAGSTARVQGDLPGPRLVQRGQTMIVFDADSGRHLQTLDRTQQGAGRRLLAMMRPLHYGYFWPGIGEALYFALGLVATLSVLSGMVIWAARDRSRKRLPPGAFTAVERANAGVMGGLMPALAIMATANALARIPALSGLGLDFLGSQDLLSGRPVAPELLAFVGLWAVLGLGLSRLTPALAWQVSLFSTATALLALPPLGAAGAGSLRAYLAYGGQGEALGHALACLALALVAAFALHRIRSAASSSISKGGNP